jgi:hypothetical protein
MVRSELNRVHVAQESVKEDEEEKEKGPWQMDSGRWAVASFTA